MFLFDWHKHWHISKNYEQIIKGLTLHYFLLDDIIIYNKTAEENLDHLQQVSTNFVMQE